MDKFNWKNGKKAKKQKVGKPFNGRAIRSGRVGRNGLTYKQAEDKYFGRA